MNGFVSFVKGFLRWLATHFTVVKCVVLYTCGFTKWLALGELKIFYMWSISVSHCLPTCWSGIKNKQNKVSLRVSATMFWAFTMYSQALYRKTNRCIWISYHPTPSSSEMQTSEPLAKASIQEWQENHSRPRQFFLSSQ